MQEIIFQPIGRVRSPHSEPKGTPIQPTAAEGVEGTVEILPEYVEGLTDMDSFSHLILLM